MWIIGCDFHPSGQQVFGMDKATGEVVADRWLSHEGNEVEEFYGWLPAGSEVGVEGSGNMLWFERLVAGHGHKLRIGDAARIRAQETRRQKHDRRDAELITRLMMNNTFPELAWVPTMEQRDQRQLLMHRHKLVRMRTQIKNQLQHIAMNQGHQRKRKLWTKAGRELLEKLPLERWTAVRRDELLELLDVLEQRCNMLDAAVAKAAAEEPAARLLMTHPGVGPVISLAFVLTIGQVQRFDNSRKLVSYLGLNPSEHSSGEKRRLGAISKQGSVFLRLLLIQGAQSVVKADAQLRRQYQRLAKKKGHKAIAKVMVARKLAVRMFWMLKDEKEYPEVVRMQGSSSHPVVETTGRLCEHPASSTDQPC